MKTNVSLAFLFSLILCSNNLKSLDAVPAATTQPVPSELYEQSRQLDTHGNYWLYWKTNDTHVTFETHVKTRGYVGFGLSSNGKMYPTDVVVGWVDDTGNTHFKDCHTLGHYAPVLDASQDYSLVQGKEYEFGTMLKFTRKLDTCDDNDFLITDSTIKVIWSYHPNDPTSFSALSWHGSERRGAKSVMLLSSLKTSQFVAPSDAEKFDMLHHHFHVPARDTTYQCRVFKVPHLTKKYHMIRYEPIITPGNENHVHHVLVYNCPSASDSDVHSVFNCYGTRPKHLENCNSVIMAWAVGGKAFDFPPNAGFSFGAAGDPEYLIMETHFNNPTLRDDIVDSSGLRITATPTLRQYDAGIMETGAVVNKLQFVPPYEKEFLSKHECSKDCLQTALQTPTSSIKAFSILLHAHLLGVGIKARHIRGEVELEPISEDKTYDFDYQDFRALPKEREIKYGDSLTIECTYDSSGRTTPTLGGLPTSAEMCLAFIFYYPKTSVSTCLSEALYPTIGRDPFHNVDTMYSWNWQDKTVRDSFKGILENSTYYHYCAGDNVHPDKNYNLYIAKFHEPATKYAPPPRHCPA